MLSMDPFPPATTDVTPGGGRSGHGVDIPQALRGRLELAGFSDKNLRDALSRVADLNVKELELSSFAGEPAYVVTLGRRNTRVVSLDGRVRDEFDRQRVIEIVQKAAEPIGLADIRMIDQYDMYYLDRRRRLPLPVILARLNDADETRYYIDPKTTRVVGTYSSRHWVSRWLYHGLHSLDVPWLYNHRPAWDLVVITFMLGGTALSGTALILAWRVLGSQRTFWARRTVFRSNNVH
jgi:hypothetical protein